MSTVSANGLRIAYEECGGPGATPMLLVLGLGAQMILSRDDFCQAPCGVAARADQGHA